MNLRPTGKIHLLAGLLMLSSLIFVSCAKRIPPEEALEIPKAPRVHDLKVRNGDGMAVIVWNSEKRAGQPMLGYNIYISMKANPDLTEVQPFNTAPYPGDTDGDISVETFEAIPLENGVEYFVFVRSVRLDGTESEPTGVVSFVPRKEGTFVLKQNFQANESGFDFGKGVSIAARSEGNDIYFYSKSGENGFGSPKRLGGLLRKSLFMDLGAKTDFDKLNSFRTENFSGREKLVIHSGHVYIVKTRGNCFGKLKVESIRGRQGQREVVIRYCFQPKPNCGRF
ncbi:MAG: hypothetical protein ACE5JC_07975 [Candidatus Zixiibacteriota bacterium]